MANSSVKVASESGGKGLVFFSLLLILAGFVGYFLFPDRLWYLSYGSLVVGFVAGIACFLFSSAGNKFIGFSKDAYREVRKVVWPTKKEALQTTAAVFVFVLIMATFLWLSDKVIEWGVFSVILGWK